MTRNRQSQRYTTEEYDHLIKILLLGDSAVGKSSLLLRFCENKFEPSFVLTIGVDFKKKIVQCGGKKVKLQVWDTAGQERFRTITPAYFRSAMGVVMVYDITSLETFENIRYWMRNLRDYGDPDVQTIIVGNKMDISHARQIRTQQGRDLAKEFNAEFFETSAKYGSSVESTFMSLANSILSRRFPQANPKLEDMGREANDAAKQSRIDLQAFADEKLNKENDCKAKDISSVETNGRVQGVEGEGGGLAADSNGEAAGHIPPIGISLHRPLEEKKQSAKKCCGVGGG